MMNRREFLQRSERTWLATGAALASSGGKYVTVYFDDPSYTARRPKNYQPKLRKEKRTRVPYPDHGRKY